VLLDIVGELDRTDEVRVRVDEGDLLGRRHSAALLGAAEATRGPQDGEPSRGGEGVRVLVPVEGEGIAAQALDPGVHVVLDIRVEAAHHRHGDADTGLHDGGQPVLTVQQVAVPVELDGLASERPPAGSHVAGVCEHLGFAQVAVADVRREPPLGLGGSDDDVGLRGLAGGGSGVTLASMSPSSRGCVTGKLLMSGSG
jgi:hypothetical protein